ncbi:hypothetical protein ANHS_644 [Ligilactobacillus ruminis ATCC 25644]|nr:hypothetical protein ANHS_644 [Ligilactobacillus ruminis ATCC 25644]
MVPCALNLDQQVEKIILSLEIQSGLRAKSRFLRSDRKILPYPKDSAKSGDFKASISAPALNF